MAHKDTVAARIKHITQAAANEWKEQLDMLLEENSNLRELLSDHVPAGQDRKSKRSARHGARQNGKRQRTVS